MNNELSNKVQAIIFGHAVGDAVGGPVQFQKRKERDRYPVTDMMPLYGANLPKGAWSDDTSMSLCAMDAIIRRGLDFEAVMENFQKWLYENEFTPTGRTFDVGSSCRTAIERFHMGCKAEECGCCGEYENGNGSLMRIYPFALYLFYAEIPLKLKLFLIHRASALTHAHSRSCIGCGIYTFVLWELLENPTKQGIRYGLRRAEVYYKYEPEFEVYRRLCPRREYFRIIEGSDALPRREYLHNVEEIDELPREEINSSGYVVDTLEAAVWCALTTDNYRDCVLKAANLGLDTDSVGAVAGSLAGLLYGYDGIPEEWRNALCRKEYLTKIGTAFCEKLLMQ